MGVSGICSRSTTAGGFPVNSGSILLMVVAVAVRQLQVVVVGNN